MPPPKVITTLTLTLALVHAMDNTQPVGTNPIENFTVEFLGNQVADNSASHRDLGFAGQLQGKWYAVYGDTLWCAPGVTDPSNDTEGFHGMVRDSLSALTDDALMVHDLHLNDDEPVAHQKQFIPFNETWGETNVFGFGGTSIVEVDEEAGIGAVYYLVVCSSRLQVQVSTAPPNALQNDAENYKGAGIAKVELIDGEPTVTHRFGDNGWWWPGDTVAHYGDVAAYRDVRSDYVYLLGNPPNSQSGFPASSYVYQARVVAGDAFDWDKYEYWWGRDQGWKSEVLTTFNAETAVMWGVGQGQIVYSEYFGTYIYVHLGELQEASPTESVLIHNRPGRKCRPSSHRTESRRTLDGRQEDIYCHTN